MGLQKYRADFAGEKYPNNATPYYTRWMGGPSLALIKDCPTPFGPRTVYIQGEPDTFFSQPAACTFKGRTVTGYICFDDGNVEFRAHSDSWCFPRVKMVED